MRELVRNCVCFVLVVFAALLYSECVGSAAEPHSAKAEKANFSAKVRIGSTQPKNRTIDYNLSPADALARVDESLIELVRLVDKAGNAGCDVVTFPEDTLGLGKWEAANHAVLQDVLPEAIDRMLKRLGAAASQHQMYLVCCNDTVEADGALRNTAFFLGRDGREIGRYNKVQPTLHENRKPGHTFPVFPTPDLGGVGMLICYDMVFPESVRCLALGGADIVFVSTLGGAAIGDDDISRAASRTRAVDNFVYLVVSWRESGSMIISPQGTILAEVNGPDEVVIADIDPFGGREGGDAFNQQQDMRARLFRERNPAAYGLLIDPNPPVLSKLPASISRPEAARIFEQALTIGEGEFQAAASLAAAEKSEEAIAAFERLRAVYPGTWIDRVARERIEELRQRDTK
ncbi:MAG: carbon-nitrogen hydrolase family protein [Planctomycetia bacterium]|nr:carbon-nitrogen hydrolase family protein [Planctomycetia bacterium]